MQESKNRYTNKIVSAINEESLRLSGVVTEVNSQIKHLETGLLRSMYLTTFSFPVPLSPEDQDKNQQVYLEWCAPREKPYKRYRIHLAIYTEHPRRNSHERVLVSRVILYHADMRSKLKYGRYLSNFAEEIFMNIKTFSDSLIGEILKD